MVKEATVNSRIAAVDSFILKSVAVVCMIIDHIGFCFSSSLPAEVYFLFRFIGRTAMPIYCFMIAQGLTYTRNIKKYLLRLAVFAVVSEVPFDLVVSGSAWYPQYQNVMLTLFLGLVCIALCEFFKKRGRAEFIAACLVLVPVFCFVAELCRCDYGMFGVLMIFSFYISSGRWYLKAALLVVVGVVLYGIVNGTTQAELFGRSFTVIFEAPCVLALIPILMYNGKKGISNKAVKYGFYAFYPVHLLILWILTIVL